eukprot:1371031-Alexandrium_andersonii.AAC.1
MRLARVDEEGFPGPAPAAVSTAPPSGRQVRQKEPKCLKRGGRRKHGVILITQSLWQHDDSERWALPNP